MLGLHLADTQVIDPTTSPLRKEFADLYVALRAHKGVTADAAWDLMGDSTYFATMLVHTGRVDGMVSGAAHTTANTVRPALEIIRTAPDAALVSSAFFMCLPHKVLVFADCAVNLDPDAGQLADIAVRTAETAAAFGIEPVLAMVSYSTGTSGTGAGVEKVRAATELVAALRPDLPLTGPDPVRRGGRPQRGGFEAAGRCRCRPRERAHLSRSQYREHDVQGGPTLSRCGGDRPGPAGAAASGQ